jgi:GNAT superfamily N-acetyltransferase
VRFRRHALADLGEIRGPITQLYLETYAAGRTEVFFSPERFAERLDDHTGPGWSAVTAWRGDEAAGFAYACPLPPDTPWWQGVEPPPDPPFVREDGRRTLALLQLMVREPWRGLGVARRLHDLLLEGRDEERVTLLVEAAHPRVEARYREWGYRQVGRQRPYPDGPRYHVLLRPLTSAG